MKTPTHLIYICIACLLTGCNPFVDNIKPDKRVIAVGTQVKLKGISEKSVNRYDTVSHTQVYFTRPAFVEQILRRGDDPNLTERMMSEYVVRDKDGHDWTIWDGNLEVVR